jgi:hypothetical protein
MSMIIIKDIKDLKLQKVLEIVININQNIIKMTEMI